MDLFYEITGLFFVLLGIAGSFLPVLPGPLTGWVGLLLLHLSDRVPDDSNFFDPHFLYCFRRVFIGLYYSRFRY